MEDLLTTREAAEKLGITGGRVRQLIYEGRLPAQKIGNMNLIRVEDLHLIADRKHGRPKKAA